MTSSRYRDTKQLARCAFLIVRTKAMSALPHSGGPPDMTAGQNGMWPSPKCYRTCLAFLQEKGLSSSQASSSVVS